MRRRVWGLAWCLVLGLAACPKTPDPKTPKAPTAGKDAPSEAPKGRRFRITDKGQVYPTINTTDCLRWPNEEMKTQAGQSAWGGYAPQDGEEGDLVAMLPHCSQKDTLVHVLKIGARVVPVGEGGVEEIVAGSRREKLASYRVVDAGQLYSSINTGDCLRWPSEEIKAKAGSGSWGSFYPKNGDVGFLVGSSMHCSSEGTVVYVLRVGKQYIAIGASGVTPNY